MNVEVFLYLEIQGSLFDIRLALHTAFTPILSSFLIIRGGNYCVISGRDESRPYLIF
jgi:hypothetical protein